jgi:hypothetical protein
MRHYTHFLCPHLYLSILFSETSESMKSSIFWDITPGKHYATSRKVAGSTPDEVNEFLQYA